MKSDKQIIEDTRSGYNHIASHFSLTRNKFWVDGPVFAEIINEGDKVLDVGCGSGRFAPFVIDKKAKYTGCDNAQAIISIAQDQYQSEHATFLEASVLDLPFKENSFDKVFCLATIHHLPSYASQFQAMSEFFRVLKNGGTCIITLWNIHAQYYKDKLQLTDDQLKDKHITVPWRTPQGENKMDRYVYAFELEECHALATDVGFKIVQSYYMNHGKPSTQFEGHNIYLELTKK